MKPEDKSWGFNFKEKSKEESKSDNSGKSGKSGVPNLYSMNKGGDVYSPSYGGNVTINNFRSTDDLNTEAFG